MHGANTRTVIYGPYPHLADVRKVLARHLWIHPHNRHSMECFYGVGELQHDMSSWLLNNTTSVPRPLSEVRCKLIFKYSEHFQPDFDHLRPFGRRERRLEVKLINTKTTSPDFMSAEVVAPITTTIIHGSRKKAKSLPTVVYRMNSSGSASFNLDDDEFYEQQEFDTIESEPEGSDESLEIHLNNW